MTFARCLIAFTMLLTVETVVAQGIAVTAEPISPTSIRSALPTGPLVLPPEVDIGAATTFIKIGFGLDESVRFQSTQLLTPRLRIVQAQKLIALVKSYNNFEGEKVAAAMTEFRGKVSSIEFGREGSPVLYIDLPYWTHQREETVLAGKGEKIPDNENAKLVERLKQVFIKKLAADEFDVEGRRIRIWWD
ncbi:hypothetical protein [Stenotrophobium rhamnosiphilum]|uniref:Chalcone isomerase domain-containing protein n=1 Tax=Stenotrophobium rhamnosiphilum TaxID=2029166 RepID=A0A2T5MDC0_9GAMM|nr:hypothetical protein [Stenotrophobium rhamnosiphilum]PTU30564.1 hypothetical protein CJD38_13740 [Stenotrophobium rhamnosiphilum]